MLNKVGLRRKRENDVDVKRRENEREGNVERGIGSRGRRRKGEITIGGGE